MSLRSFVRTASWCLCQPKLNVSKTKICNRMWCSSDTPFDELHPFSSGDDNSSQENVSCESEMLYFMGESGFGEREQSKRERKSVPIKQMLAYTNKALFGPLIETAAEKKSRLKREEHDIDEEFYNEKKRFGAEKKQNSNFKVQPLVFKSENSHYLGIFPGNCSSRSSANEPNMSKVRITLHHPEDVNDSSHGVTLHKFFESSNKKNLIFKKPSQYTKNLKNRDRLYSHVGTKPQKVQVLSWVNDKEHEKQTEAELDVREIASHRRKSIGEHVNNSNIYSYNTQVNMDKKQKSDEASLHVNKSTENNPGSSCILVDNSKFSAVPDSMDINMIKSFPLFNTSASDNFLSRQSSESNYPPAKDDIVTIGIFENGYQKLPSVRKILEETMPLPNKIALEKWKAKMTEELGEEGFQQYRKGLLDRGMLFHGCIQSELRGETPSTQEMPSIEGLWTSLKQILPNVTEVNVLESRLIHPYLYYQGAVDCIGSYRGTPVLIEWKTSTKTKLSLKSMFDDPLQVVAYLGALNFDSNYKLPRHVETAMLVVAYDSGLPAHVHTLKREKCEHYWEIWCSRLIQFWKQLEFKKPDMEIGESKSDKT